MFDRWSDLDDEDQSTDVFSDDDCEIIDSAEVYSVQSGSESEQGFENYSDEDEL